MGEFDGAREAITNICHFIGLSERGAILEADAVLKSMSEEELRGAFRALAGAYSGLASLLGMDLSDMDSDESVAYYVHQVETAMQAIKGQLGYN